MSEGKPERSKGTSAPMCKVCETRHWGTCANHESRGYLSVSSGATRPSKPSSLEPALKAAVAKAAAVKPKAKKRARRGSAS